ncbi:MAG: TetR/AcrR family transcriptional regulator [Candidatus Choladocola sp.]|nr:TetR/AcrR family transcriptional regulator [Candidatus Choladocola sp.]
MKREEKIQLSRRRILDGALEEFSKQGYGASSLNNICTRQGISKGIIYHYFDTKDALFLACVEECFQRLTEYLRTEMRQETDTFDEMLEEYFMVRMAFFKYHPVYQRIFCDAMITPPAHLNEDIQRIKHDFDMINRSIMEKIFEQVTLRSNITKAEIIDTFRQFQDFINVRYQMTGIGEQEFEAREKSCRKALNILLYGIVERKEN